MLQLPLTRFDPAACIQPAPAVRSGRRVTKRNRRCESERARTAEGAAPLPCSRCLARYSRRSASSIGSSGPAGSLGSPRWAPSGRERPGGGGTRVHGRTGRQGGPSVSPWAHGKRQRGSRCPRTSVPPGQSRAPQRVAYAGRRHARGCGWCVFVTPVTIRNAADGGGRPSRPRDADADPSDTARSRSAHAFLARVAKAFILCPALHFAVPPRGAGMRRFSHRRATFWQDRRSFPHGCSPHRARAPRTAVPLAQ